MTHHQKIEFLSKYATKKFRMWQKLYGDNIAGVHVGRKRVRNKKIKRYSIVFHVISKRNVKTRQIPKYIKVSFPDSTVKFIPTDVIETGKLQLAYVKPGDKTHNLNFNEYGALGLFLFDDTNFYILSNMHVLAPDLVYSQHSTEYYLSPKDQIEPDIEIYNKRNNVYAYLQDAIFNVIDAGIARLDDPNNISNSIFNYGPPGGITTIGRNEIGINVFMAGAKSGEQIGSIIDFNIKKDTHITNIALDYLILTDIPITFGDSGSPVFDYELNVIGIIVAFDNEGSYVIPIDLILEYFDKSLLLN